jgi:hypothetical protein
MKVRSIIVAFGLVIFTGEAVKSQTVDLGSDILNYEPYTRTNAKVRFNKDTPLLESGFTGKAHLLFYQTSEND